VGLMATSHGAFLNTERTPVKYAFDARRAVSRYLARRLS
jgi:hypothetical protein